MAAKCFVYRLSDPRDGTVRYVDQTTKSLQERLVGHLASPTNPAMRAWISLLGKQGVIPAITAVATVDEAQLDVEEKRRIEEHIRKGHRLFNAPRYYQHLRDLSVVRTGGEDRFGAFMRRQFEPIATAHLAGRMSWRSAAWRVAVKSALITLYLLWSLRVVRFLAVSSVAGWYLWDIGFDNLMRDVVLPHVPAAELVALWHHYFADPLLSVALHFGVTIPPLVVLSYFGVRNDVLTRQ
ncbi:hypothetical protein ABZV67_46310 [Streptomyces sp. NPDC005065]|uniref:hypothetical protein n=1 Tax=Streptomyces sp. NPDC005065 TaxID=3154461 RepID=UPI0033B82160